MSLSPFTKTLAQKKLSEFCDRRVPQHVRDKLRLTFKLRGKSVTLSEERAPWKEDMAEWTSLPIAQLRYDEHKNNWKLFCADKDDNWQWYQEFEAGLDDVLDELDHDPTGIFWG